MAKPTALMNNGVYGGGVILLIVALLYWNRTIRNTGALVGVAVAAGVGYYNYPTASEMSG